MITSRQRVSSRGIERTGLTEEEARGAEEDYDAAQSLIRRAVGRTIRTGSTGRSARSPFSWSTSLRSAMAGEDLRGERPVVAWSISFPSTRREEDLVEYVVNTTWYREHYLGEDDDEDVVDVE